MKYSKLQYEIETLQLKHKHDKELLKMKQDMEMNELLAKCTHTYEDGTTARQYVGSQWDSRYDCRICGKTIS